MDHATFDRRTIVAAALAVLGFVALGVSIAVFGAPDDPTPVLAGRSAESTTTLGTTDGSVASTTTTTIDPVIEIEFEPVQGLGFEQRRRWEYDRPSRTLRNVIALEPEAGELLIGHVEVLPPSVLALGDFDFEPGTDDVTVAGDGTKTYRFEVLSRADEPGEVRWEVVTDAELDEADLGTLAADLGRAIDAK